MKNFGAKFLISSFFIFNASVANAQLYKITFSAANFVDQNTPTMNGTLSGFIIINDGLGQSQTSYTAGSDFGVAISGLNWLDSASLTFTPDNGDPAETRTLTGVGPFTQINWQTKTGSFDPTLEFVNQMSAFGLSNGGNFSGAVGGDTLIQRYDTGEFALTTPASTEAVPGPLPLMGLIPFAYYIKKLRKKSYKL
ncbi:MAG: hypothetical protein JJ845_001630 [Prochlorococcus marinus CUG1436]|nr:hypothetical protein [Prochlorococcus marinus CUG1436]